MPKAVKVSAKSGIAGAVRAAFRIFQSKSKLTLSQWADKYRYLSPEDSAEPGKWHTDRAEYARGIMDAITDTKTREVVVMKGAQIGWTAILGNAIGYFASQEPCPMLVIQPAIEAADAWSSERLAPMIRDTPVLTHLFADPKSRDGTNKIRKKEFPGGFLAVVGANAAHGLSARPIRAVLCDELDRWTLDAGGEGDPLNLAKARQQTYFNAITLKGSTPAEKETSVIEREYKRSDMREFQIPCADCGEFQVLRWANVHWDKLETDETAPLFPHQVETAHYTCEHCGVLWTDAMRWDAVSAGHWVATAPFNGIAGFHLSALYSPWVHLAESVQQFIEAKRSSPKELQVFVNTVLGESYEVDSQKVGAEGLIERTHDWDGTAPNEILVITCGIDVQDNRIEIERVGWCDREESYSLEHVVYYGVPTDSNLWRQVDNYLADPTERPDGRLIPVDATCIDTGGHFTQSVYKFVKPRFGRRIYGIKGATDRAAPVWPPPKSVKKTKVGNPLFLIGVHAAKEVIYSRLNIPEPGPGYCHFPAGRPAAYFKQLTAEVVKTKFVNSWPKKIFELPPGRRNEALDLRVYAYAALEALNVRWPQMMALRAHNSSAPPPRPGRKIHKRDEKQDEKPADKPAATPPENKPAPRRRRTVTRSKWV